MTSIAAARKAGVPWPVHLARALLAVVAVSHAVVPVVMWAGQGALRDQIGARRPDLGAAEVAQAADIAVVCGAAFHAALLVLCLVLVAKLPGARPSIRRLTTISQLLSVAFSAVSWSSSPMFHAVIPIIDAIRIVLVIVLWAPRPARAFFSARELRGARR